MATTTNTNFIDNSKINDLLTGVEDQTMQLQIRLQAHQAFMTTVKSVFDAEKEANETARKMLDEATRA